MRGTGRKTWGGARPGSGPHRRRLQLDKETAKVLSKLTKQARAVNPAVTEETIVATLVARAWRELDSDYQAAAVELPE